MRNGNILFPHGHAVGKAFCGRKEERQQLKYAFKHNGHIVLVAPRRYGKSSLIKQTLIDTKLTGKRIDLLPATNIEFVQRAIKVCFSEIANQIMPKAKLAKQKLIDMVHSLCPKLKLSLLGQSLEIGAAKLPELEISDILVALNEIAKSVKTRVIICFDEFQQISFLKGNHAIEASIRHAVESSTHVTYVFSGSSRHLLQQMFTDRSRPLYHLCDLMEIGRIKETEYVEVLQRRMKTRWRSALQSRVIEEIMMLTKRHPYYVNALCRILWQLDSAPAVNVVQKAWLDYVDSQNRWLGDEIANLSPIQRNILAALAYAPTQTPYATEFSTKLKLSPGSIKVSLAHLVKKDFAYRDEQGYFRVVDPALETYLLGIDFFGL